MKRIVCLCLAFFMINIKIYAENPPLSFDVKSALLMEQSTGKVLYEQNADEQLPIASVTKIMTMLLIMEALDEGKITLEDQVSVSERAMSMGGSTMFLETGDLISVDEMLKGIAVASANDGCVAMSEFIAGSESEFVRRMNERAKELDMKNTAFVNTNGLDANGHYSSARDVAIMSRELLKHEGIFKYTTIWTDTMRNGKFGLANTNKLIRFYDGANGLKTGSTSKALCCLSATAKRNNMQLIGVVLGASTSDVRFSTARALLDYGFASYSIENILAENTEFERVPVNKGVLEDVGAMYETPVNNLIKKGDASSIEIKKNYSESITCPIYKGDELGEAIVYNNGEEIGRSKIKSCEDVEKKTYFMIYKDLLNILFCKK